MPARSGSRLAVGSETPSHAKLKDDHILLYRLRLQLQNFESSPDFGDGEAVAAIRRHLLVRIREAESLVQDRLPVRVERMPQAEAA